MVLMTQMVRRSLCCLVGGAIGLSLPFSARAQTPSPTGLTPYTTCQPPNVGEYLLLVVSQTPQSQEQVRRSLPPSSPAVVCTYLNDVVTRVGGFGTVDLANAWAKYITETVGAPAFIARPSATAAPVAGGTIASPPQSTATSSTGYNPQTLGAGYAVLVDFFSRPDLAAQVQQAAGKAIGLASYGQRPYLLVTHTTDQATANTVLQTLSERGFWTMVVDSRRVTLLRPAIAVQ